MVVGVLVFYVVMWYGFGDFFGWAISEFMFEDFRFYWVVIEEFDKVRGGDGKIYFWICEFDEVGLVEGVPRVY